MSTLAKSIVSLFVGVLLAIALVAVCTKEDARPSTHNSITTTK